MTGKPKAPTQRLGVGQKWLIERKGAVILTSVRIIEAWPHAVEVRVLTKGGYPEHSESEYIARDMVRFVQRVL